MKKKKASQNTQDLAKALDRAIQHSEEEEGEVKQLTPKEMIDHLCIVLAQLCIDTGLTSAHVQAKVKNNIRLLKSVPSGPQWKKVKSSNVSEVAYDPDSEALDVRFTNGKQYLYLDVPSGVAEGLLEADSVGTYLNTSIKPYYRCVGPINHTDSLEIPE